MAVSTKKYNQTSDVTNQYGTRVIGLNGYGNGTTSSSAKSNSSNDVYVGGNPTNGQSAYPATNTTTTSKTTTTSGNNGSYSSPAFSTSAKTNSYASRLADLEDDGKPAWSSKYESTISGILDSILNRKAFDVNTDTNYNQLYNNYAERYQTQADRSMRDTLASANAATGGYGSTYGQAVAQQAYDQTMQGMNDQNLALMQMAYQMYGDETADRYNQLGAVTNLDNTDYSRYRDDVSDYYTDLNYLANRYDTNYANDYSAYTNDRNFNYGVYSDDRNYTYKEYQDAMTMAQQYANAGQAIPDYIQKIINNYSSAMGYGDNASSQLASLAQQKVSSGTNPGSIKDKGKDPVSADEYVWDIDALKDSIRAGADPTEVNSNLRKMQEYYYSLYKAGKISQSEYQDFVSRGTKVTNTYIKGLK